MTDLTQQHYERDEDVPDEVFLEGRRTKADRRRAYRDINMFPGTRCLSEREALAALSQLGEVVYACRCADGTIKIGHSASFATRFDNIKLVASGAEVVAFTFGSYDDEQAIHRQLAEHRHHGREWYHPHPEVLAVINGWRERLGRDPIAA